MGTCGVKTRPACANAGHAGSTEQISAAGLQIEVCRCLGALGLLYGVFRM